MFLATSLKNASHQQSPLDNPGANPAFTIRRHLLQAKEENIQIEQMKKVISISRKKEIISIRSFLYFK
jgi:hypothetical protein